MQPVTPAFPHRATPVDSPGPSCSRQVWARQRSPVLERIVRLGLGVSLLISSCLATATSTDIELDGYKVWTDVDNAAVVARFTRPGVDLESVQLVALSLTDQPIETFRLLGQATWTDDRGAQGFESVFITPAGLQLTTRITAVHDSLVDIEYLLTNSGPDPLKIGNTSLRIGRGLNKLEDPGGGYGGWLYAVLDPFIADSRQARRLEPEPDHHTLALAPGQWVGWHNRYEVAAIRLQENTFTPAVTIAGGETPGDTDELLVQMDRLPELLQPGQSLSLPLQGLLAQKDKKKLAEPDIQLDRLLLLNLWDWFRWLCFAIWAILDMIYAGCGNWGLTIILLALVVRIFTIPVTRLSLKYQEASLQQQTRMTPLIQEIKDRYSGIEQSEKLIELYETRHYDHLVPFKAMLGLFVQIPIFIALFNVLGEAHELRGVSFLWIADLAKSDRWFDMGMDLPYFGQYFNLLPFLMAAVTVLSTWLSARYSGTGRTQSATLFGMAGVFFVLFYSFPSALVLYWMFSNLFQLVQQSLEHHFRKDPGKLSPNPG